MEGFNVEKKKGNYEEITKLAQEMMLKINKGNIINLLRMEGKREEGEGRKERRRREKVEEGEGRKEEEGVRKEEERRRWEKEFCSLLYLDINLENEFGEDDISSIYSSHEKKWQDFKDLKPLNK